MAIALSNNMNNLIFRRIGLLVFSLITVLSVLFIIITYLSATYFFNASTELLNKDVAAHIAKFTSPFEDTNINKRKADSVFYNAMVVSPSIEVYFLDTAGKVIYFESPDSAIKLWQIPLQNINKLIASKGEIYTTAPDPKDPEHDKIFSAAEVIHNQKKLGYIYVILGSKAYNNMSELLFKSHAARLALQAFAIIIVVSVFISLYYIKRLQRRYNAVISVLDEYKRGNFNARFPENKKDEFTPVTTSFNAMADLLSENINRLKKGEQERKNFIANISHDLRTPLSIASGYAETLANENDKINITKQKQYMQLVVSKLKQVEDMVMQLFELSKLDSVDFKPAGEPFIFSEIVEEITNSFSMAASGKHIRLSCVGCQEVVWTNGDIKMMERVLQNLISNAIKNTPEQGAITIRLQQQNEKLTTLLDNEGEPLSTALLHWINSDDAANLLQTRPLHKTGLGLVIVKRILALHDAKLTASINEKGGNRFQFSLPVYGNTSL